MSSRNSFRKIAVTNGLKTTNLLANAALTTSYNLTLPSTLPTIGPQALFSDTAGNLSWNSTLTNSTSTSFAGANSQTSAAPVTGLLMTTTSYATTTVYVVVAATKNQAAVFSLTSTFNSGGVYNLEFTSVGDDTGVLFTINASTGQVSYTSPTIQGFVSLSLTWLIPKVITNYLPSATNSVFSAASPQVSAASVTGLITTTSYTVVNVYVQVSATTNLTALFTLTIYSKSGLYALQVSNIGDDTGTVFSILSATGQVQYTAPSYTGWTATTFQWTNPATLTTTPTTLGSLAITGPFQVTNGGVTIGTQGASLTSSTLSLTTGSWLTIPSQTIQDAATAASGTLAGYSLAYLGIPTLAATNTAVTTTTASTLTIAGPPTAGVNETITNSYALNVQSGQSYFGGNVITPSLYYYKGYNTTPEISNEANGSVAVFPALLTFITNFPTLPAFSNTSQATWTVPSTGVWHFTLVGAVNPGSLVVNIYVVSYANNGPVTNSRNNIVFDNGSGGATNYTTRSGSSFLSTGDVVGLSVSSTSTTTTSVYVNMLGIYQLTRSA